MHGNKDMKKKKKNVRSQEERKKERQEIRAILDEARKEKQKEEKAIRQRKNSFSFSMDAVRLFISDLEFKKNDVVFDTIVDDTPSTVIKDKENPNQEETYYERWYHLVAGKQIESKLSTSD